MERVVVFGSTGQTGICAVEAAVQKGLNVRAFVRDPSKLPDHLRNSVEVVKGDILNYTDVYNAIKNVTAVIATLGTGTDLGPTTVMSDGLTNIIKAMKELKVEIISACFSTYMFYGPEKTPEQYKEITADHRREFEVLKASGLKYIAVCPPHIAAKPGSSYEIKHDGSAGRSVSKHDLGQFFVDCLTQPEHYGRVCGITSK